MKEDNCITERDKQRELVTIMYAVLYVYLSE